MMAANTIQYTRLSCPGASRSGVSLQPATSRLEEYPNTTRKSGVAQVPGGPDFGGKTFRRPIKIAPLPGDFRVPLGSYKPRPLKELCDLPPHRNRACTVQFAPRYGLEALTSRAYDIIVCRPL